MPRPIAETQRDARLDKALEAYVNSDPPKQSVSLVPGGKSLAHYAKIAGAIWAATVAGATVVGWVFGLGKQSADYPTKKYVDDLHAGELQVSEDRRKETESIGNRLTKIETLLSVQSADITEIKGDVKDLAPLRSKLMNEGRRP